MQETHLTQIRSASFAGVSLRLNGEGVAPNSSGSGKADCQYGAHPWTNFHLRQNTNGTVSLESYSFPNVFLRMDGHGVTQFEPNGGGVVNAQSGAAGFEQFKLIGNEDGTHSLASTDPSFPEVYLRMDGTGLSEYLNDALGPVNCQYSIGAWEKFTLCECITEDQCHGAINQFLEWFPAESGNIEKYREDIVMACCAPFHPKTPLSVLENVQYQSVSPIPIHKKSDDDCAIAVFAVGFDIIGVVLTLVGLGGLGRDLYYRRKGYFNVDKYLIGFKRSIQAIKNAQTNAAAAKSVFIFLNEIWNAGLLRDIWGLLKHEMPWWRWVTSALIALAQIIAWIGTDGVGFVAEVLLLIPSIISLVTDGIDLNRECFGPEPAMA